MKIIAFSGKKQSGKTTAVDNLERRLAGNCSKCGQQLWIAKICFADFLKEIVMQCFEFEGELDDGKVKDTVLACGKTPRELLQYIGTDIMRKIDPACWITSYRNEIRNWGGDIGIVLTPDVRFPNEVKCIQDLGGHVIRLLRAPFPEDRHESETALDNMEQRAMLGAFLDNETIAVVRNGIIESHFDAIIDNREMTVEQQNEAVWKLVNEKGWI